MKVSVLFSALACFIVHLSVSAQADHIGHASIPGHPRILLLKGEEGTIQKSIAADKVWGDVQQALLNEADRMMQLPPVERIQIGRRLLDKSREALRRIFMLSYAYRTTGEKKYADRAEQEMLKIAGFTDWNPSHFLDVAEMTMAMAIGYDWLYNELGADARAAIKEAIITKGLEPSLDEKYNGWLKATHNWNQVCNAGMAYGAMAVWEDQPDLSKKIINRAIESIRLPMEDYRPDGAYPEGYSYWGYGTSFNVLFISAVEKLFGKDFGLGSSEGFLKTGGYLENMTGTFGLPFNYSDAGSGTELHPAMFWFAARTKDPSLLWAERGQLTGNNLKKIVGNRLLPAVLLWSNGVAINNIHPPASTMWAGQGKNPVALMRTSWTDSNAIYVGMKAGSASVNHAHMDIGSFVMDADGVRWAMDFGMQDYESLESKGVQVFGRDQAAQRWSIYRYNNHVHNTLTANGQLQRVEGYAAFSSTSVSPSFMFGITDMSTVYKGSLAKAIRGVGIVDRQYVAVRDEVEAIDTPTTVRWTLLTPADVKIVGKNEAELTRSGKKLLLRVEEPAGITIQTSPTTPTHSYDAPNPGTTLVSFDIKLRPRSQGAITVLLIPQSNGQPATRKIRPLKYWK